MSNLSVIGSVNQEKQQQINRKFVIDLLRKAGICSRADLAKASGLKRATITNIINELIEKDIVVEEGIMTGKKGRRSIGIRIHGERYKVISVMLARKSYSIGIMGLDNKMYHTETMKIEPGQNLHEILNHIKADIKRIIKENVEGQIIAIGVAIPGPYKHDNDKLIFVTNLDSLNVMEGINVLAELQSDFDIPVYIENDANAGVYAQQWYYNEDHLENLIYVVAGAGLGCGTILNGELLKGARGIAGEFGHCSINFEGPKCGCGNRGCLEMYCSLNVLIHNVKERIMAGEDTILHSDFTLEDLSCAVRGNDKVAVEEYTKVCSLLAVGIVNLIHQLNPEVIVIGDELADIHSELLLHIVKKRVQELIPHTIWENLRIEINQLKYNPILIGAGVVATEKILEHVSEFAEEAE